jgi:outer membrane receptor protein involved in Fe transport
MTMRMSGLLGAVAAMAGPAFGQQASDQAGAQIYEPAYFTQFNVSTAEDMVRQLPGFALDEGDNVRGFGGAAGNVLIDGARPSTKTPLRTLLGRIPATNVARIEIVTGASATLDMRGQTKVANVVLKAGLSTSSNWQVVTRHNRGGRITGSVEGSSTFEVLGGSMTASLEVGQPMMGGPGGGTRGRSTRAYYDGSLQVVEQHSGMFVNQRETFEPSLEYSKPFGWGTLNLNGAFEAAEGSGWRYYEVHTPDYSGPITRTETQDNAYDNARYDLGGDIDFPFAGGTTKLITLHTRRSGSSENLYDFYTDTGAFDRSVLLNSDDSSGESIGRAQISWTLSEAHTVEVSVEGAYNFLDSARTVTLDTGADATPPGSDTLVEEYRGEAQISDVWKISSHLTLEPGMKFEYSRIKQEARLGGGTSLFTEREFTYPKPSITGTWRPNATQQVRVSLKREVGQLNFSDFVSAVEVVNNQVTGGNADLKPQQVWAFETQFEQKFWGDGVLTLIGSYDKVSDVEDQVPVVPLGGSLANAYDGPGNLGDGEQWSLGFTASIPLQRLGIPNSRLDLSLDSGNSEVVDPVTGETREFSNAFNRQWRIEYRQDLQSLGFSYGFSFGESGGGSAYRLKEIYKRQKTGGDLSVFVETTRFFGVNVRAGVNDIFDPAYVSNRSVYDAARSTGNLTLLQRAESRNGPIAYLRVKGSF